MLAPRPTCPVGVLGGWDGVGSERTSVALMFNGCFAASFVALNETTISMPSTAGRLRTLIVENFDLDEGPSLDASLSDLDTASVNAIAFFKLVNNEFDLGLKANDCEQFETLTDLLRFIDSRAA